MSVNLVLNSRNSLSYDSGKASFFVNWSQFYEDDPNAKYNVSFSFSSEVDNTLDQDDIYTLNLDNIGANMRTITSIGQFGVGSSTSSVLGVVYPEDAQGVHIRLVSHFNDNPPVTLHQRPVENLLEVSFRDLAQSFSEKTPQFILIIRFEKI